MPRRAKPIPHVPYIDKRPDCSRKQKYNTSDQANKMAELRMLESSQLKLSVYRCNTCSKWHLTSIK